MPAVAVTAGNNIVMRAASAVGGSAGNITIGGVISGTNLLTKTGTNNLTLTATNINTGGTTVSNGTLMLSGAAGRLGNGGK